MDSLIFNSDFTAALRRICQAIDWDYGEVWIPSPEKTLLEISPIWYGNSDRSSDRLHELENFRACSEKFVLSLNEGLPGRIWKTHRASWINDVSVQLESYFLRNLMAKAFNVKAGFGFPVFCEQEIVSIFVFFTSEAYEEDPDLVKLAIRVAFPSGHEKFYVI
jgi:hypothetical protein